MDQERKMDQESKMKRYDIDVQKRQLGDRAIIESDTGGWVRYDDVLGEIKNAIWYGINEGLLGSTFDDTWQEYVLDGVSVTHIPKDCQKTVEKLSNRIENRDKKISKLQRRIKKLEESGAE
jgi:hypothetical protein